MNFIKPCLINSYKYVTMSLNNIHVFHINNSVYSDMTFVYFSHYVQREQKLND